MLYRKEIDGLRALAVLPVIFFHAGFQIFSGGFVGVDVFFVISGYLIMSLILTEKEVGKFTLKSFYERRARRILPALFFVICCCLLVGLFTLTPNQWQSFGKSITAVSIFSSNILFWSETGYFAPAVELKPLLHTWSLAIEEQFYLIFPATMLILWRLGKPWLIACIIAIIWFSFEASEWGWRNAPISNFYFIKSRVWELLSGVLVAYYLHKRPDSSLRIAFITNQIASLLGLGLILYSVFSFDKNTPFPSTYTLLPVLGTALIIVCAKKDIFVTKLLSFKGFVYVGLVSYSAYLWHHPLLVFTRMLSIEPPTELALIFVSALSIFCGWLSWRFIEKPFRNRNNFTSKQILVMSVLASLLLISIGTKMNDGSISNKNLWWGSDIEAAGYRYSSSIESLRRISDLLPNSSNQTPFTNDNRRKLLFIGDSHAKDIAAALLTIPNIAKNYQIKAPFIHRYCLGTDYSEAIYSTHHCATKIAALKSRNQLQAADVIVIMVRYSDIKGDTAEFLSEFIETNFLDYQKKLVLMGNNVEFEPDIIWQTYKTIAMRKNSPKPTDLEALFYSKLNRDIIKINQQVQMVAVSFMVPYVDNFHMICSEPLKSCDVIDENKYILYRDNNHWTIEGVKYFGEKLSAQDWLRKKD